jgi:immunity protein Imm1 of predicted polymorphic toxin system
MYIESLHYDRWVERNDVGSTVAGDHLSVYAVNEAVRRLEGAERTLVTLQGPGTSHLAVGGSAATGMVVYATFDNDTFYQLTNPEAREDEIVEVVAGGQTGDYPARMVVGLSVALQAAEEFAEGGVLSSQLAWVAS